jgi:hypothetical protein
MAPLILISALDGDEWPTSGPGRFTPGKEPPYPLRSPGGDHIGLDVSNKRKILSLPGFEPWTLQSEF